MAAHHKLVRSLLGFTAMGGDEDTAEAVMAGRAQRRDSLGRFASGPRGSGGSTEIGSNTTASRDRSEKLKGVAAQVKTLDTIASMSRNLQTLGKQQLDMLKRLVDGTKNGKGNGGGLLTTMLEYTDIKAVGGWIKGIAAASFGMIIGSIKRAGFAAVGGLGKVIKNGLSHFGGAILKHAGVLKLLPKLAGRLTGILGAAMALYDGLSGWNNAESIIGRKLDPKEWQGKIAGALGGVLGGFTSWIGDNWTQESWGKWLDESMTGATKTIQDTFGGIRDAIGSVMGSIVDTTKDLASKGVELAGKLIDDSFTGIVGAMKSFFGGAVDRVLSWAKYMMFGASDGGLNGILPSDPTAASMNKSGGGLTGGGALPPGMAKKLLQGTTGMSPATGSNPLIGDDSDAVGSRAGMGPAARQMAATAAVADGSEVGVYKGIKLIGDDSDAVGSRAGMGPAARQMAATAAVADGSEVGVYKGIKKAFEDGLIVRLPTANSNIPPLTDDDAAKAAAASGSGKGNGIGGTTIGGGKQSPTAGSGPATIHNQGKAIWDAYRKGGVAGALGKAGSLLEDITSANGQIDKQSRPGSSKADAFGSGGGRGASGADVGPRRSANAAPGSRSNSGDTPTNVSKFINSIGARETGFRDQEGRGDAMNLPANNKNVEKGMREEGLTLEQAQAKYGDYGHYQTNQTDVDQAIKFGVPPDVAKHLNGGGPDGRSTPAQQHQAMNAYLQKLNPEGYAAAQRGDWDAANEAFKGKWPSLPGGNSYNPRTDDEARKALSGEQVGSSVVPGSGNPTGSVGQATGSKEGWDGRWGATTDPDDEERRGIKHAYNYDGPLSGEMVTVESKSGAKFKVDSSVAGNYKGLIDDLEARGYDIDRQQSSGFADRNIAGSSRKSQHGLGNAIDVNWDRNTVGGSGVNDLPSDVASLAQKHGLSWGGNIRNGQNKNDTMHFEYNDAHGVKQKTLADLEDERKIAQQASPKPEQVSTPGAQKPTGGKDFVARMFGQMRARRESGAEDKTTGGGVIDRKVQTIPIGRSAAASTPADPAGVGVSFGDTSLGLLPSVDGRPQGIKVDDDHNAGGSNPRVGVAQAEDFAPPDSEVKPPENTPAPPPPPPAQQQTDSGGGDSGGGWRASSINDNDGNGNFSDLMIANQSYIV